MAKPWSEIEKKMAPKSLKRAKRRAEELRLEVTLADLRKIVGEMTQVDLATLLRVEQPQVSKIENADDTLISTLRSYVHALGGCLRVVAVFDDREVVLSKYSEDPKAAHSD